MSWPASVLGVLTASSQQAVCDVILHLIQLENPRNPFCRPQKRSLLLNTGFIAHAVFLPFWWSVSPLPSFLLLFSISLPLSRSFQHTVGLNGIGRPCRILVCIIQPHF